MNNIEILIADFKEFENRIKYLRYSIEGSPIFTIFVTKNPKSEIQKEENWTQDPDFSSAVVENLGVIAKVINHQQLCLAAIEKIDPNNTLVKENQPETLESRIKALETERISLVTLLRSLEKPETQEPEGLLL